MNVFVAGATGVAGRRAVRELVAAGHDVRAVARTPEKAALIERLGGRPERVDLFDADIVLGVTRGSGAIVNLATHIPPPSDGWRTSAWDENTRLRTEATANLAGAAIADGARYVQESITFPYVDAGDRWIDESSAYDVTPLTESVVAAEASAARVTSAGGTGVVLRFGSFYAPDSTHTVQIVKAARRGIAAVVGPPDAFQSSIHADDVATAVVAALAAPAGTYNVVDDEPLPRGEVVAALGRALGKALPVPPSPPTSDTLGASKVNMLERSQRVSNRAFCAATNWAPSVPSVRDGWPQVIEEIDEKKRAQP